MLKVLTLNTWLLRVPLGIELAKSIEMRASLTPYYISKLDVDLVFLQEVWDPKIRNQFRHEFKALGYPFCASMQEDSANNSSFLETPAYLRGGAGSSAYSFGRFLFHSVKNTMGSGLMIFSRLPLVSEFQTLKFSKNTRLDENFAQKGAIKATVSIEGLGFVDIYNAHFGAVTYQSTKKMFDPSECYRRMQQVEEFAVWMKKTRTSPHALFACDLNVHPFEHCQGTYSKNQTPEYLAITHPLSGLGLQDSFAEVFSLEIPEGNTDTQENPFKLTGHFANSPDARLDYIFSTNGLDPVFSQRVFTTKDQILSDHFGVLSVFSSKNKTKSKTFSNRNLNFLPVANS